MSNNYQDLWSEVSVILSKILDWVIHIKEESALCFSHLQFGFKNGMLETVNYYNFLKSNVFVIMLVNLLIELITVNCLENY